MKTLIYTTLLTVLIGFGSVNAQETNTLTSETLVIKYFKSPNGKYTFIKPDSTNVVSADYALRYIKSMVSLGYKDSAENKTSRLMTVIHGKTATVSVERWKSYAESTKREKTYEEMGILEKQKYDQEQQRKKREAWREFNTPKPVGNTYYFEGGNVYQDYEYRGMKISTRNGKPIMVVK